MSLRVLEKGSDIVNRKIREVRLIAQYMPSINNRQELTQLFSTLPYVAYHLILCRYYAMITFHAITMQQHAYYNTRFPFLFLIFIIFQYIRHCVNLCFFLKPCNYCTECIT